MKHIIFILFFIYTSCIACSSDNDKSSLPAIRPDAEGTWIDPGIIRHTTGFVTGI